MEGNGSELSILCSSCFHDEGLKFAACDIGVEEAGECPNCGDIHHISVWFVLAQCPSRLYTVYRFAVSIR